MCAELGKTPCDLACGKLQSAAFGTQRSPVQIRPTRPGQRPYLTRCQMLCRHKTGDRSALQSRLHVAGGKQDDVGDRSASDGEGHDGHRSPVFGGEEAGGPIDEHGCDDVVRPRVGEGALADASASLRCSWRERSRPSSTFLSRSCWACSPKVNASSRGRLSTETTSGVRGHSPTRFLPGLMSLRRTKWWAPATP